MVKSKFPAKSVKSKKAVGAKLSPAKPAVISDFSKQKKPSKTPTAKALTATTLSSIISKLANRKVSFSGPPVMQLSARHPYDPAGLMDVYMPGRWDCTYDLVFMDVIRSTGPSPGEWEGSVIYAQFTAPAAGTYAIVVNFSGYQITLSLNGPWGNNTAYNATNASSSAAVALWAATSGQKLSFTVNCTGSILGYVQSIQVFQVG